MKLKVSEKAVEWFKEEFDVDSGDYVQIFSKIYGGIPTIFPSYFLGLEVGKDGDIIYQDKHDGIVFYINERNAWLLENHRMEVDVEDDDIQFHFIED